MVCRGVCYVFLCCLAACVSAQLESDELALVQVQVKPNTQRHGVSNNPWAVLDEFGAFESGDLIGLLILDRIFLNVDDLAHKISMYLGLVNDIDEFFISYLMADWAGHVESAPPVLTNTVHAMLAPTVQQSSFVDVFYSTWRENKALGLVDSVWSKIAAPVASYGLAVRNVQLSADSDIMRALNTVTTFLEQADKDLQPTLSDLREHGVDPNTTAGMFRWTNVVHHIKDDVLKPLEQETNETDLVKRLLHETAVMKIKALDAWLSSNQAQHAMSGALGEEYDQLVDWARANIRQTGEAMDGVQDALQIWRGYSNDTRQSLKKLQTAADKLFDDLEACAQIIQPSGHASEAKQQSLDLVTKAIAWAFESASPYIMAMLDGYATERGDTSLAIERLLKEVNTTAGARNEVVKA
mmetsp:Transcript_34191/g.71489  ORF Transcript_34191/g.71489 Transcript_34191/m.71489 type:complete len:411 (+) Transcript_34191:66-1298(+)